ncbi:FecR family protein [Methylopila jiangsuensis]|nr:FecR domain-containing protein [Methylopila jiangsuensis]
MDARSDARPTPEQRAAADAWLMRRDGDQSARDEAEFDAWLAADPRHPLAFAETERLWSAIGLPLARAQDRRAAAHVRWRPGRMAIGGMALTAGLALAAIAPGLIADFGADIVTGRGETAERRLPDGSTVRVAADTALDVDFAGATRRVTIRRGEAFFDVISNPARPFVVDGGPARVRVTGTAFNVERADERASVVVARGSVEVSLPDGSATEALAPGERVEAEDGRLGPTETVDLDMELGWMSGRIAFSQQPLGEVVAALQRQTDARIALRGDLSGRLVSGSFPLSDVDANLDALAAAVGARVLRVTPWLRVVY